MKNNNRIIVLLMMLTLVLIAKAQKNGFEGPSLSGLSTGSRSHLSLDTLLMKEGSQSLKWEFAPSDTLVYRLDKPFSLSRAMKEQGGIQLWLHTPSPLADSLRFEMLAPNGKVAYSFYFRSFAAGWRACWIGFRFMKVEAEVKNIAGWRIIAPKRKGTIRVDRMTFPVKRMNERTTPDLQLPHNNDLAYRDLWHWCRVWEWEQYRYDIPLPTSLSANHKRELKEMEQRLDERLHFPENTDEAIRKANELFRRAHLRMTSEGVTGIPLVMPDDGYNATSEFRLNEVETMLYGFALDYLLNHRAESRRNYFAVWQYAISQGFAYGSGMGTNHHYGYQVRDIYTSAWWMRQEIAKEKNRTDIIETLRFWSALQETRKPYKKGRDELLDSWHTLLEAKLIAALLQPHLTERWQAMSGLSRWLSTSLVYTPGTLGGIKPDGTAFHHGGFYPAYTEGVPAAFGTYLYVTNGTAAQLTHRAAAILRQMCLTMTRYTNTYEWAIGIGGRHPFRGNLTQEDVDGMGQLACLFDNRRGTVSPDRELAEAYLRLSIQPSSLTRLFSSHGLRPGKAPEGTWALNYGSAAIHRRADWLATARGYNTDVWGAEIYTRDNRFGRYQSYGSLQILHASGRAASGFSPEGWDWNRLPGTTTIHLPLDSLNSPLPGTTMAKSRETFAGASALEGRNGMFAMKLMERDLPRFTADFVARKSVFFFGNRLVCLGSGITNTNHRYPTETTLFQVTSNANDSTSLYQSVHGKPVLTDGYRHYYFVRDGRLRIKTALQHSLDEKTLRPNSGHFAVAYLDHGYAPTNEAYEYMVLVAPSTAELEQAASGLPYQVLEHTSAIHAVVDKLTGIRAYAVFDDWASERDSLLGAAGKEVMLMIRPEGKLLHTSVCDSDLNIEEKAFTTASPSRAKQKSLLLRGSWQLAAPHPSVRCRAEGGNTRLEVTVVDGIPVEFVLQENR